MVQGAYKSHWRLFRDYRYPLILIGLALAVRVYLYFLTFVISRDGVTFLSIAQYFKQGEITKGLGHDFHPLYSMMIAAGSYLVGDSQLTGQIISIVAGSLLVLPVFYLGKSLFEEQVGFVTGLLAAFHPYLARISADVLSDSLYIFFFASGINAGWDALKRRRRLSFFLAGVYAAFAYLTRPEGIGILILIGFWVLMAGSRSFGIPARKVVASFLLLVFGFLIFASPYLIYLRKETGHWILTKKKSVGAIIGIESKRTEFIDNMNSRTKAEKISTQGGREVWTSVNMMEPIHAEFFSVIPIEVLKKVFKFFVKLTTTFHLILFLFFLFGVYKSKKISGMDKRQWFILSFLFLYLPILYLLFLNIGYVSHRHLPPVFVIGLFWTAVGVQESRIWALRKVCELNPLRGLSPNKVSSIVMILIIAILLPMTLKPQRRDKVWIKQAGLWITENCPINPKIMGYDSRIAYYAGGTNVETLAGYTFQEIESVLESKEVDIVVLESHQIDRDLSGSVSFGNKTLNPVHELIDLKGRRFLVCRILDY